MEDSPKPSSDQCILITKKKIKDYFRVDNLSHNTVEKSSGINVELIEQFYFKKVIDTSSSNQYNRLCQLKLKSGVDDSKGYTRSHPEHDG